MCRRHSSAAVGVGGNMNIRHALVVLSGDKDLVFFSEDLDDAIVGTTLDIVSNSLRVVYSKSEMLEILPEDVVLGLEQKFVGHRGPLIVTDVHGF